MRIRVMLPGVALVALVSAGAQAQSPTATTAAAEELFDEARRLMQAGDYASACPKFAESQKLDPGLGTLLNLGTCYEKMGRTATAWVVFKQAAADASEARQADREKFARDAITRLEPNLATLAVDVPPQALVPGLSIKEDGQTLPDGTWQVAVPVDPGEHLVEAVAPGKKPASQRVTVAARAAVRVAIPVLERDPAAASESSAHGAGAIATLGSGTLGGGAPGERAPVSPRSSSASALKIAGWFTLGVGGSAALAGGVLVLAGGIAYAHANSYCAGDACQPGWASNRNSAYHQAAIGQWFLMGGALVAAAGVVIVLAAPSSAHSSAPRAALGVAPGALLLSGAF